MSREPLLRVEGLVKDFGGLRAVNGCTFAVEEGSITGLIGPNGAGKTTVFNLITGFLKPDAGRVSFRGEEITGLPPYRIFRKGLARTFQIPREHRLLTVLENLMLVPLGQLGEGFWNVWFRPQAVRAQEEAIRQRALEVLDFVELLHLKDEYAGNLSGGQRKLLELARVLMAEPKMVLLDEPGAGVNPTLMKKLAEKILELNQKGLTFLIIEHDMDLVMRLCDPIVVLSEGSVLKEGSPEAVRRDPKVLEAYLGGQYGAFEG